MSPLARVRALAEQAARDANEASQVFVDAILEMGGQVSPPCRIEARALRALVNADPGVPVRVVPDACPPTILGSAGRHTTPSGKTIVHNPRSYGYRTVYQRATIRLEVGMLWLTSWRCRGGGR